ncbi:MAG: tetratricopeptide repeat protein [Desulfobacterales bacterium]|nr:tetratricopeptide repeat protein [Desulfobacterales bacterium]
MQNKKIVLSDAYKQFTLDQDKIMAPAETVKRVRTKFETLDLDILESTRRIDNGRLDIPVFFSRCGKDARARTGTTKQMGKGATPEQAEASAVMELVERFSFFSFCHNPANFFTDTYKNLKSKALPFDMIARSVHDISDELDVARPLFESLPLKWTTGYNLTQDRAVLIPFDWFYMINEFNGPSAGNCIEEAVSQGICEIVERHVSSVISRGHRQVPRIRPESATDPAVKDMLAKYERAGIRLFISDFSLDIGIPSVGVLAYDPATFPAESEIVWTAGTTPDPQKALSRTLTEVAQLAGDFNTGANFVASGLPKFTRLESANFITTEENFVDIGDLPDLSDNNIKTEIHNLLGALSKNDMQAILIDTTHAQLEIPAFYTIIPGAHFRERAHGTSVGMFSAKFIAENNPPDSAIKLLGDFDRKLPGKYYNQFYIGLCQLAAGRPPQALSSLERALDLDPTRQDIPSIYSYMGQSLKEMERYDDALVILQKGATADNERTDIYNLMGFCHFKLKAHEEAIRCFRRAIELNPGSAIDYANIASNYRDLGQTDQAIEYYETALALDPTIDFALKNLMKLQEGRRRR